MPAMLLLHYCNIEETRDRKTKGTVPAIFSGRDCRGKWEGGGEGKVLMQKMFRKSVIFWLNV